MPVAPRAFVTCRRSISMAWRSHGTDNQSLVDHLKNNGIVKSDLVYNAMLNADRGDFIEHEAYLDQPVYMGFNATISAPHMHAYALEYLKTHIKPGSRVLDIGSGSGYLVACLSKLVGETGKVVGIEHIKELADQSIVNLKKSHQSEYDSCRINIVCGDGRKGFEEMAPYDAIHIGAAADESVVPALTAKLGMGGILLGPFGKSGWAGQDFRSYVKDKNGEVEVQNLMGVRYIPLTSEEEQRRGTA